MTQTVKGIVVRSQSGFYTVDTPQGQVIAHLRGHIKQGQRTTDLVAVGDWVQLSMQDDGKGMIEAVEERKSKLSRLDPTPRGVYEQIIVANPDLAAFVFACADPEPRLRMLDRFLVIAEQQGLPSIIVANKVDRTGWWRARRIFGHYPRLGYPVFYTSAKSGRGVAKLRQRLKGKVSVFAGPSGAGKSSLLNRLLPGAGLQVQAVNPLSGKGKHTTVVRELFPLGDGGYVADTPGLKALALWDIEPEELDGYFPELRDLVTQCQYRSCTHMEEPGCAVVAAVEKGKVHPERYESYLRLRLGDAD